MLTHFMNTVHLLVSDIKGYETIIHRRVYLSSTCTPYPNMSACIPTCQHASQTPNISADTVS